MMVDDVGFADHSPISWETKTLTQTPGISYGDLFGIPYFVKLETVLNLKLLSKSRILFYLHAF